MCGARELGERQWHKVGRELGKQGVYTVEQRCAAVIGPERHNVAAAADVEQLAHGFAIKGVAPFGSYLGQRFEHKQAVGHFGVRQLQRRCTHHAAVAGQQVDVDNAVVIHPVLALDGAPHVALNLLSSAQHIGGRHRGVYCHSRIDKQVV